MITLEISFGKGDKATTRTITIDPEGITLGFLEDLEAAQETRKWAPIKSAICELLDLTADEGRQITMRQFKALSVAMQGAATEQTAIPNG